MSTERLLSAVADRYHIERELGAGGMATVYLARDLKHDRMVALKVLRPELAAVIGADRFLAEIRTTAALQHPHLLPLFDSGAADNLLFYVMPFVDGETLRDRLQREKQLPIADCVRIATEVAGALDYAHRHGVVHRDIKPENILLHDGSALVADFGIAFAASKAGGKRMTETGMSLGTPQYMSPEQAMGEREVSARGDVYSLGAVTYEMLLGEPPFTGPTAQSIVARVMTERPPRMISRRERIPVEVETAVLTALEKLPADRFGTAAEFATALRTPIAARSDLHNTAGLRVPAVSRLDWRVAGVVGAVIGGTVVAAAMIATQTPSADAGDFATASRTQLTFNGTSGGAAVSPDGGYVAYVQTACSRGQLNPCVNSVFTQERGSDRPVAVLRDLPGVLAPRFNHDGSLLVLAARLDSIRIGLFAVPRLGGMARQVGPVGAFDTHARGDSAMVVAAGFARVIELAKGTTVDSVPVPDKPVHAIGWSPDGDLIAAIENYTRLTIFRRDGSVADSVNGAFRATVRWTPDGSGILVFRALPVNEDDLLYFPIDANGRIGTTPRVVVSAIQTLLSGEFDVARQTGEIVLTTGSMNFDMWTFELTPGAGPGTRRPTGTTWYSAAAISADGNRVYYQRGDAKGDNLYELTLPDTEQSLTADHYPASFGVQVSRDGARVSFANSQETEKRIGIMTLATRQVRYIAERNFSDFIPPMFTARGIVFVLRSGDGIGIQDTVDAPTRVLRLPDTLGLLRLAVDQTGDSAVVLVTSQRRASLAITPLSEWRPRWLHEFKVGEQPGLLTWANDGAISFWYWPDGDPAPGLWQVMPSGGKPVRLRFLPTECNSGYIQVAVAAPRGVCVAPDMRRDIWLLNVPGVTR